jgi:hypothetical protein
MFSTPQKTSSSKLSLSIFATSCCLLLGVFSTTQAIFLSHPVYAEDDILKNITHRKLNDTERGNISMNCASIQTSLKNVQRNDSKTRVILGTNYQTLLSNYISPLNVRLIKNNLPDSTLISIQSEAITSRNSFTNLFVTYSQRLESLISIDCKNQPDTFYSELENVRFLRSQLEESVNKVNTALSNHLKTVNQLREKLSNNSTDSTSTSTSTSTKINTSEDSSTTQTNITSSQNEEKSR